MAYRQICFCVSQYDFNRVCENLFVVHIPKINGEKTKIEHLFPADLLTTELDGKKFNPNPNFDSEKEYSKIVFAEKVVRTNQDNIDFKGFKPLFDRIENVIEGYKNYKQINLDANSAVLHLHRLFAMLCSTRRLLKEGNSTTPQ